MNKNNLQLQLLYRNHQKRGSTLSSIPNLSLTTLPQAQELMAKIAYERYLTIQNTHPSLTTLSIRPRHASVRVGTRLIIEMEITNGTDNAQT